MAKPDVEPIRLGFLDTNVALGTSIAVLTEIRDRGWRLRLSDIALIEMMAHVPDDKKILPRLARLRDLLDPDERIAPTHTVLIDKLGGRVVNMSVGGEYQRWKVARGATLDEPLTLADLDPAALSDLRKLVANREGDFARTLVLATAHGEAGPVDVNELASIVAEAARLPVYVDGGAVERLHLYNALIGLHGARAARYYLLTKAGSAPRFDPNSSHDLNVAQHLAEGGWVITDDRRFIVDVDATGSFQAPWVRTPWELLDLDDVPVGLPWGDGARAIAAAHRRRTTKGLAEVEKKCRRLRGNA